jgi:hypothetical protein
MLDKAQVIADVLAMEHTRDNDSGLFGVTANGSAADVVWWDATHEAAVHALVVDALTPDAAARIHAIVAAAEDALGDEGGAGFGRAVLIAPPSSRDPFDAPPDVAGYTLDCMYVHRRGRWAAYAVYDAAD